MKEQEVEYVEVEFMARVPKPIYEFLKDYNTLAGRTVEENLREDFESIVVDWTLDFVQGLNHKEGIIEKYGLEKVKDC